MARRDWLKNSGKELQKFERSLATGRSHIVPVWNRGERMAVRAHGWMSPEQFKEQVSPVHYSGWDVMEHDPETQKGKEFPEVVKHFTGNVDYKIDDLINVVREEGIKRPVIISQQKQYQPDWDYEKGQWRKDSPDRHALLDGHHRAYAAMKAGKPIPVWIAAEEEIELR